jgi:hypothetical protein
MIPKGRGNAVSLVRDVTKSRNVVSLDALVGEQDELLLLTWEGLRGFER